MRREAASPKDGIGRMLDFLSEHRRRLSPALILTHDFPDPDALATAHALRYLLRREYAIRSHIAYGGVVGRMENRSMVKRLGIPVRSLRPGDFRRHRATFLVDTQASFDNNRFPKNRRPTMVIDQHVGGSRSHAEFALIDPTCGATSAILARVLLGLRKPFPRNIATALAYGILTDTMHFLRPCRPDVLETYRALVPLSNLRTLARIQNPRRSQDYFTALSRGILNARESQRLIVSNLGAVENPDLISLVADALLPYRRVRWALCTGRFPPNLHVSLRASRPRPVPARALRRALGSSGSAGGHGTIAGGQILVGERAPESDWRAAERRVLEGAARALGLDRGGEFRYPFRKRELQRAKGGRSP